ISDSNSGYNESDPYAGRDPRLSLYILCNGMKAGHENTVIYTAADGTTNDGLGKISTSTRTGYYMKKLLNQNVSCNSASQVNRKHYTARMRYTEFFLNYAEAANEAWGPMGTGTSGYSAYDVIKEIRHRAGVGLENDDAYLESIKGDKDAMRALIRNERRLELCFEGFRFFDLRRWKSELNETAKGVSIENGVFNVINVESRNFREYMIYCPIPNSEVLKYSNLKQNAGW
ncbi:MAG: RagB/SusD family nutrient uptake outer membrane protein, partial [Muribaculaceae bacterium]|nr:RagB/SusD family nutrient uptake outer membrane protein [Muribaculaceae bacterium]